MEETLVPRLAFGVLKEVEENYKKSGTFSSEDLESLHSFFGENLVLATELLEKCKVIEYITDNGIRHVFKLVTRKEQYTIYENINFCQCETFELQVLEARQSLTCKHVLAVKLAQLTGQITKEVITESQYMDFINEQLNFIEDERKREFDGQE